MHPIVMPPADPLADVPPAAQIPVIRERAAASDRRTRALQALLLAAIERREAEAAERRAAELEGHARERA